MPVAALILALCAFILELHLAVVGRGPMRKSACSSDTNVCSWRKADLRLLLTKVGRGVGRHRRELGLSQGQLAEAAPGGARTLVVVAGV